MNVRHYCRDDTLVRRFWDKVLFASPQDCWLWQGGIDRARIGHGWIGTSDGMDRAHRIAFRFIHGDIPHGLSICHSCDVPRCVNPNHLWLGTHQENIEDMVEKDRGAEGANAPGWKRWRGKLPPPRPHVKLSEADVAAIRMDARGAKRLGKAYGVSHQHITRIKKRQSRTSVL